MIFWLICIFSINDLLIKYELITLSSSSFKNAPCIRSASISQTNISCLQFELQLHFTLRQQQSPCSILRNTFHTHTHTHIYWLAIFYLKSFSNNLSYVKFELHLTIRLYVHNCLIPSEPPLSWLVESIVSQKTILHKETQRVDRSCDSESGTTIFESKVPIYPAPD